MSTNTEESAFEGNSAINSLQCSTKNITVSEIYLDGKLKKAELVDENEKSYGIFIHSLILSNSKQVVGLKSNQLNITEDEFEKAINWYTDSRGFNKEFIESIAPKVTDLTLQPDEHLKASAYMINGKFRLITKGEPESLLKRCTFVLSESRFIKITRRLLREINEILKVMVKKGLNVYAIAIKDIAKLPMTNRIGSEMDDLTLVALVGFGKA